MTNFKCRETKFYARLLHGSEEGPFESPPGCKKVGLIRKLLPGAPKLYSFQGRNSVCVLCSFSWSFLFVGDKVAADNFKGEIITWIKTKYRVQFGFEV